MIVRETKQNKTTTFALESVGYLEEVPEYKTTFFADFETPKLRGHLILR